MRYRATIDPRLSLKGKHNSVTVSGDPLIVDIDEQELAIEVGEAHARSVADQMRSQPDGKWNRTGHLASGLTVRAAGDDSAELVAPADRLQRPGLVDRLAEDIAALHSPERDRRLNEAIDKSADGIVKVRR